jgi:two-component system, NtrC family, sensor kinase
LQREGMPIGVLLLQRTIVQPFTDNEIGLAETFADQAVIAIENVRLFEAEQQRTRELTEPLEQQTATSEVLRVISSSPGELEPVFQAMLENAVRICDAKFGTLQLREDGAFRLAAMHNPPPAYAEARRRNPLIIPSAHNALGRVIATKRPVHIADYKEDPAYKARDPAAVSFVEWGTNPCHRSDAQGRRIDRQSPPLPPRGTPIYRNADCLAYQLRRPGRHRYREYAVAK